MALWEVVGGGDKGGILIREGEELKSPATAERLSTGSIVEEIELKGERLHYKLVEGTGTGPAEGWASLKISGKDLLIPKEDIEPPGEWAEVEVDEAKKAEIEAKGKEMADKFLLYVMKYKVLGFPLASKPKMRIFCFHNAGSAESQYTGPGTALINWIKEVKDVELLAFDYPGRDKLNKATKHVTIDTLSPELLALAYDKIADGVPYLVWGHSVGTWVCFEFLMMARKIGLPMPKAAFLMAFPAPHMPTSKRPWGKSISMTDAQLKTELAQWDKGHFEGPGKVVFDEPGWKDTWSPMMRADFRLFDEYKFKHSGVPKFEFPIHSWHMEGEFYNKAEMIAMWGDWTFNTFDHKVMKDMGHLTCFYNPKYKKEYFNQVTEHIKKYYDEVI